MKKFFYSLPSYFIFIGLIILLTNLVIYFSKAAIFLNEVAFVMVAVTVLLSLITLIMYNKEAKNSKTKTKLLDFLSFITKAMFGSTIAFFIILAVVYYNGNYAYYKDLAINYADLYWYMNSIYIAIAILLIGIMLLAFRANNLRKNKAWASTGNNIKIANASRAVGVTIATAAILLIVLTMLSLTFVLSCVFIASCRSGFKIPW